MADTLGRASDGHDIHIRPAGPVDADCVADVYLAAYRATYRFPLAHPDDQVREWLRGYVASGTAWVAVAGTGTPGSGPASAGADVPGAPDRDDLVVGFLGLEGHELDQLYVRPGWWGRGIGTRLLGLAKERSAEGLALWTFQVNARARRFYERHGFAVVRQTAGDGNEERQPDVRYAWLPESDIVRSWDAVYAGRPPWDIGRPQSAFQALADAGELQGRVLDVGCGTGEHTLMAAALGLDATGIDIASSALAIAREKATERVLDARFLAWDATRLAILGERWQTVLDSGVFHVFDDAARARYVASLAAVVEPGGRYHMLVFGDRRAEASGHAASTRTRSGRRSRMAGRCARSRPRSWRRRPASIPGPAVVPPGPGPGWQRSSGARAATGPGRPVARARPWSERPHRGCPARPMPPRAPRGRRP